MPLVEIFGIRANTNFGYQYRTLLRLRYQKFGIRFGFELRSETPLRRNFLGSENQISKKFALNSKCVLQCTKQSSLCLNTVQTELTICQEFGKFLLEIVNKKFCLAAYDISAIFKNRVKSLGSKLSDFYGRK